MDKGEILRSGNNRRALLIKTMKKVLAVACLAALTTGAQAQDKLPTEFYELPLFIQREVRGIRASCAEMMKESGVQESEPWPMAGINAFYLDRTPAILIDDRHVCNNVYKGANCHTWGCDVRIYRQTTKDWEKILDEPVGQLFLSTSNNSVFILAALSFTGKYEEKCGRPRVEHCDYLLSRKNGKWNWQKLQ
jgi:hypothetical protein